ncbi:CU044_2847 family protein [Streptomyces sp. NPDC002935]|uniref:CU044_2847 family protein n=1 Tax=unclassified Streptomyces TaxID=2593676 RepID=UPI0033213E2A
MTTLTRIPLDGGGSILFEQPAAASDGPVKAGRIGDVVRELPMTLQGALEPITVAAQATLEQLRKARPDVITVRFGVELGAEAGAVITRTQATCHLNVTVSWKRDGVEPPPPIESTG